MMDPPDHSDSTVTNNSFVAHYSAVYRVHGLSRLEEVRVDLQAATGEHEIAIYLTSDISAKADEYGRKAGIAGLVMTGLSRQAKDPDDPALDLQGRWKKYSTQALDEIKAHIRDGVYLVVEARDAVSGMSRKIDDLHVAIDAVPAGYFGGLCNESVNRAIAALAATLESKFATRLKKVFEYSILEDQDGKIAYNVTITMGDVEVEISTPLKSELKLQLQSNFNALSQGGDFDTPSQLLAESILSGEDKLRAYILSWAAMEILTLKLFTAYRIWDKKLADALPATAKRYFESSKAALNSRLNLVDKFTIVAETLSPATAQNDVEKFIAFKKARDGFYHSPVSTPPATDLRAFALRYLRLHLAQQNAGD